MRLEPPPSPVPVNLCRAQSDKCLLKINEPALPRLPEAMIIVGVRGISDVSVTNLSPSPTEASSNAPSKAD